MYREDFQEKTERTKLHKIQYIYINIKKKQNKNKKKNTGRLLLTLALIDTFRFLMHFLPLAAVGNIF